MIEDALRAPGEWGEGLCSLCVREIQKSLKHSATKLVENKLVQFELGEADGLKVFKDVVETPGDGVLEFQGMQDHTAETVKSFEGFQRAWFEDGQSIFKTSLQLLRPTIRWKKGDAASELWFSWNRRRKVGAVDEMLTQGALPTGAIVVNANWSDNPWLAQGAGTGAAGLHRSNSKRYLILVHRSKSRRGCNLDYSVCGP